MFSFKNETPKPNRTSHFSHMNLFSLLLNKLPIPLPKFQHVKKQFLGSPYTWVRVGLQWDQAASNTVSSFLGHLVPG